MAEMLDTAPYAGHIMGNKPISEQVNISLHAVAIPDYKQDVA
jgi:hypothetical protein